MADIGQMNKPRQKTSLMKRLVIVSLAAYFFLSGWQPANVRAQAVGGGQPPEQESVVLKWLGNAGWEIRAGKTVILIDPCLHVEKQIRLSNGKRAKPLC